jgi:hypothetical protein
MLISPGFTWGYARFDPLRRILYLIATGLTTAIDKHLLKKYHLKFSYMSCGPLKACVGRGLLSVNDNPQSTIPIEPLK